MKPNVPIAFASLLLSVMLWFVVYAQTVPDPRPVVASLSIDGLDDGQYFVRKIPSDVRLVVNAPADRAKELGDERVTASVDLSIPKTGVHDYPVSISPDWVRRYLEDAKPTVRVEVEPVDSQVVKITSVVKGALQDRNLQLVSKRLSPTQVTVRGPASEVASVREVRAYLDLAEIDSLNQEPQQSELVPLDGKGARPAHVRTIPAFAANVFKLVPAEATKPAQIVPDLDVTYDASVLPNGYSIEPKTVTLSGRPAVLANVSKVPTEVVRVRGLGRSRTFRVRLLPPAGTTIVESPVIDVTLLVRAAPEPLIAPAPHPSASTPPSGATKPLGR